MEEISNLLTKGKTVVKRSISACVGDIHISASSQGSLEYSLVSVLARDDNDCVTVRIPDVRRHSSAKGSRSRKSVTPGVYLWAF